MSTKRQETAGQHQSQVGVATRMYRGAPSLMVHVDGVLRDRAPNSNGYRTTLLLRCGHQLRRKGSAKVPCRVACPFCEVLP